MTNRKHPPGPWRVIHNKRHNSINVMTMPDDEGYCEKIALINGRDEAVAQLIAALPDTLVENTRLREENARLRSILATKMHPPFDDDLAGEPYAAKDRQPEPGGLGRVGQVEGGGEDGGA